MKRRTLSENQAQSVVAQLRDPAAQQRVAEAMVEQISSMSESERATVLSQAQSLMSQTQNGLNESIIWDRFVMILKVLVHGIVVGLALTWAFTVGSLLSVGVAVIAVISGILHIFFRLMQAEESGSGSGGNRHNSTPVNEMARIRSKLERAMKS